jgi:hypothetical protein
MPRAPTLLTLLPLLLLTACSGEGPHFPRPTLSAARATLPGHDAPNPAAQIELLALNATDAPLWLRRLDITLTAQGVDLAAGIWDGSQRIDPGASVMLDIALPLLDAAPLPTTDTPAQLTIRSRYARSGVLGILGGETHTYELPIPLRPAE